MPTRNGTETTAIFRGSQKVLTPQSEPVKVTGHCATMVEDIFQFLWFGGLNPYDLYRYGVLLKIQEYDN